MLYVRSLFFIILLFFYIILCFYYLSFSFLFICTCDFGGEWPRKNRGLSPRKLVPICLVGPCVLHSEMLGLIITGSKPLVYLKYASSGIDGKNDFVVKDIDSLGVVRWRWECDMYRRLCVKYHVFECGRGHEMKCLLYLLCMHVGLFVNFHLWRFSFVAIMLRISLYLNCFILLLGQHL